MVDLKQFKLSMEEKILNANKVIIIPHNGVDIDAVSSALGISAIAKKLKKPSYIVIDDPLHKIEHGVQVIIDEAKKDYEFIDCEKYLKFSDPDDLFILTDVNKSYLVCLKDRLINPDKIIIIDHHKEDESTINASLKFINTSASSACEIVTKLLILYKIKVVPEIANDLLAGIYLDTNRFGKGMTAETSRVMTALFNMGADISRVQYFFEEDFVSDRRVQALINRMEAINYSLAVVLAEEDTEYSKEELAKVADYLLRYRFDATFAVGKIDENTVSISARSKDKVDVEEIMRQLDGGGNQYSAATKLSDCTVEEAGKRLKKVIKPDFYKN